MDPDVRGSLVRITGMLRDLAGTEPTDRLASVAELVSYLSVVAGDPGLRRCVKGNRDKVWAQALREWGEQEEEDEDWLGAVQFWNNAKNKESALWAVMADLWLGLAAEPEDSGPRMVATCIGHLAALEDAKALPAEDKRTWLEVRDPGLASDIQAMRAGQGDKTGCIKYGLREIDLWIAEGGESLDQIKGWYGFTVGAKRHESEWPGSESWSADKLSAFAKYVWGGGKWDPAKVWPLTKPTKLGDVVLVVPGTPGKPKEATIGAFWYALVVTDADARRALAAGGGAEEEAIKAEEPKASSSAEEEAIKAQEKVKETEQRGGGGGWGAGSGWGKTAEEEAIKAKEAAARAETDRLAEEEAIKAKEKVKEIEAAAAQAEKLRLANETAARAAAELKAKEAAARAALSSVAKIGAGLGPSVQWWSVSREAQFWDEDE